MDGQREGMKEREQKGAQNERDHTDKRDKLSPEEVCFLPCKKHVTYW